MRAKTGGDPIERLRRTQRRAPAVAGVLVLIAGAWAFFPLETIDSTDESLNRDADHETTQATEAPERPVNQEVFTLARLWNPKPPPQPEERDDETRIVGRPQLELIGIIDENGKRFAALQDLKSGEILIVASGDSVPPYTVTTITSKGVVLEDGRVEARFTLARKESGGT